VSGRGYEGGYDAVRRYARRWGKAHGQSTAIAYVPLSFAPGEAYQFAWSHEIVVLNGATITVKVAHGLCHSRMPFVRAYPRESRCSMPMTVPLPFSKAPVPAAMAKFSVGGFEPWTLGIARLLGAPLKNRASPPPLKQHHSVLTFGTSSSHGTICQMSG